MRRDRAAAVADTTICGSLLPPVQLLGASAAAGVADAAVLLVVGSLRTCMFCCCWRWVQHRGVPLSVQAVQCMALNTKKHQAGSDHVSCTPVSAVVTMLQSVLQLSSLDGGKDSQWQVGHERLCRCLLLLCVNFHDKQSPARLQNSLRAGSDLIDWPSSLLARLVVFLTEISTSEIL